MCLSSADWNIATLLNNKAKIVSDWYKNSFLPANNDKFQTLCLASKARNTQEAQIFIDNEEIELEFLNTISKSLYR